MAQTDVDVCNLAIDKVGGEPIEALNEDTPLSDFCTRNYPAKRALILSKYRWVFATVFVQLAKITPTPAGCPLTHCFALPGDLIGVVHAFRDGPRADATNVRTLVSAVGAASDNGTLYAEYTAAKPEAAWPSWFTDLVVTAFAADLAARRPNEQRHRTLQEEAWGPPEMQMEGGLYLQARNSDSRSAPERQLFYDSPGPLIEARLGGFSGPFWGGVTVVDTGG